MVKKYNDIKTEYEDKIKDYTIIEKEIKKGRAGYVLITLPKENKEEI